MRGRGKGKGEESFVGIISSSAHLVHLSILRAYLYYTLCCTVYNTFDRQCLFHSPDHLVDVHVGLRSGAGLEHDKGEMV